MASEREATAIRAQRRGGIVVAVAALERAATLSADPVDRGQRLMHAAELAFELGRRDLVQGDPPAHRSNDRDLAPVALKEPSASRRRPSFAVIWFLLAVALGVLVSAIVLGVGLAFLRVSRELGADKHSDEYF